MNTEDDRVTFLGGNALQLGLVLSEEFMSSLARPLLVIEDAAHTLEVTGAVLQFFKDHLKKSEYIIVEDGIVNDLLGDQYQAYDNGPNRAILSFLESSSDFIIDENYCDYYGHNFTWCTNGYLTKIA
jgi:cephalosporin hydroxylase